MLYFLFASGIVLWLFFNYIFVRVIIDDHKDWPEYDVVLKTASVAWHIVAPLLCNVYMLYNLWITWSALTTIMS